LNEFGDARRFLAEIERAARQRASASTAVAFPDRGMKRPLIDDAQHPTPPKQLRRPAEQIMVIMQTAGLLCKLREGDGRLWFVHFDRNFSGKISKEEMIHAMVETLKEFSVTQDDARRIVEGIWSIVDENNSHEIEFGSEFVRLREMLLASTRASQR